MQNWKDLNWSVDSHGNIRSTASSANENDNNNDNKYSDVSNNIEWDSLCAWQW